MRKNYVGAYALATISVLGITAILCGIFFLIIVYPAPFLLGFFTLFLIYTIHEIATAYLHGDDHDK